MTGAGYYEQTRFRPSGLALVVAMHAAALGALVLVKSPIILEEPPVIMTGRHIPLPEVPPENPPPPVEADTPPPPNAFTAPQRKIDLPPLRDGLAASEPPQQEQYAALSGTGTTAEARPELPPVRVEAIFDPRFAADQQPPYPPDQERLQRDGRVRVRVTIGADGRVKALERLSATNDSFWRATERHARGSWRFRPATLDGRPVDSTKVITLTFQIEA